MRLLTKFIFAVGMSLVFLGYATGTDKAPIQSFANDDKQYQILQNVTLVPGPDNNRVKASLIEVQRVTTKNSHGNTKKELKAQPITADQQKEGVIGKIGNMLLIRNNSIMANTAGVENQQHKPGAVYVRDTQSGDYGIVNGEVYVVLKNREEAHEVAKSYDLTFITYVPGGNGALMQSEVVDNKFISKVMQKLRLDERVKDVELRVITDLPVPN